MNENPQVDHYWLTPKGWAVVDRRLEVIEGDVVEVEMAVCIGYGGRGCLVIIRADKPGPVRVLQAHPGERGTRVTAGHVFGHPLPECQCDPWDALIIDMGWLADGTYGGEFVALAQFWRKAARERLDVERLRAVLRGIPAIDWTQQDDLTRYASAIVEGLRATQASND